MLLENPEYPRKANSVLTQRTVLLETNDSEAQVCTNVSSLQTIYVDLPRCSGWKICNDCERENSSWLLGRWIKSVL